MDQDDVGSKTCKKILNMQNIHICDFEYEAMDMDSGILKQDAMDLISLSLMKREVGYCNCSSDQCFASLEL